MKIEKDIPIPEHGWRGAPLPNYPKTGKFPWKQLQPGDSFFVALPEGGDILRLMNRVTGSARNHFGPGRVTARTVKENGQIGVRAWLKPDPYQDELI